MVFGLLIAAGVAAGLAVAGQFVLAGRAKRHARRIERALAARPRTWIQEARGRVRVTGHVRRDAAVLRAPLSGRPCVVYEFIVEDLSAGSSLPQRWIDVRQVCPFLLEDDSGTARIDTSGAGFVALVHDHSGVTSGLYPGAHLDLGELLESWGFEPATWFGRWKPIRYAEGVLEPGELVSVGGAGVQEVDQGGDSASARSMPRRLVMRGSDAEPLLMSRARDER